MEAAPAGSPGVQQQPSIPLVCVLAVTVPEDEQIPFRLRWRVDETMDERDPARGRCHIGNLGQLRRFATGVVVAADGGKWRKFAQPGEDAVANVAGVQDVVGASECGQHIVAEEAVGIGHKPEEHRPSVRRWAASVGGGNGFAAEPSSRMLM